ncbi:MAG: TonB-dependent receptor family protein [Saprospiraceae bacterium]|nr:TonB-dependent receptor family protein [Saprospiraceae bacterium]
MTYRDALGIPGNVFLITQRLEDEKEKETDLLYSLIYKKSFPRKGHQLISDFQYEDKAAEKTSVFEEQYFDGSNNPLSGVDYLQLSGNEEGNRRLGINLDYILPLKIDGKFEAGLQSSFREIFNNYVVKEIVNSIENPDADFTNDFLYQEIIHGAYVNFGKAINKFTLQTGLRLEHSDVTTKLLATNETNPRKYADLFPSAFLTYNLSNGNAFQLSYSRRIQRPVSADLNPFFTIRDRRNIFRGNPNIEPEHTDSYELGYIRYWEKASLSSVAYFRKTDNVIKRIQRVDADFPGVTITQAENLDFKRNYGVELTYAYFPHQKWRLNGDVNIFHSLSEGTFKHEGQEVFVGGTGMDFLKKNGTLTLSVNDIFNSRRRRSFSEDETFFSEDNFLWQSRAILLSFHYRINQQKEPNRIYVNPLIEEKGVEY